MYLSKQDQIDQGPERAAQAPRSVFIIQQPQQGAVRGRQEKGGCESKENIWKMTLNAPHHSWAWLSDAVLKGGWLWRTGESCRAHIYTGNVHETRASTHLTDAVSQLVHSLF